jgi:hypothetical protein
MPNTSNTPTISDDYDTIPDPSEAYKSLLFPPTPRTTSLRSKPSSTDKTSRSGDPFYTPEASLLGSERDSHFVERLISTSSDPAPRYSGLGKSAPFQTGDSLATTPTESEYIFPRPSSDVLSSLPLSLASNFALLEPGEKGDDNASEMSEGTRSEGVTPTSSVAGSVRLVSGSFTLPGRGKTTDEARNSYEPAKPNPATPTFSRGPRKLSVPTNEAEFEKMRQDIRELKAEMEALKETQKEQKREVEKHTRLVGPGDARVMQDVTERVDKLVNETVELRRLMNGVLKLPGVGGDESKEEKAGEWPEEV